MLDASQFRKHALDLVDAPNGYEWGKENLAGADCSGTVCYPLIRMGYRIRTTADDLYRRIFTRPVHDAAAETDPERVLAVFYVMREKWEKLDGTEMPAGAVRHVTPVVGQYVVLHADGFRDRLYLATARAIRLEYERRFNCRAEWMEIDETLLDRHAAAGDMAFGIDSELGRVV